MTSKSDDSLPRTTRQTGPRSTTGKAKSSLNALQHGLLSRKLFLDGEDPKEYQRLFDALISDHRPSGLLETTLVEKIAICLWRQQRLVAAETARIGLRQSPQQPEVRTPLRKALGVSHGEADAIVDRVSEPRFGERSTASDEAALVLQMAQNAVTVPVDNDPLARYQTALDNELYKALRALREAQSWRLNHATNSIDE